MSRTLLLACSVAFAVTCALRVQAHSNTGDDLETVSPSGVFRGSWMETRRGRRFRAYRGIRYAEPPVGELRFKPPVAVHQYEGVVDASKEGPACPLPVGPEYYVAEDCLRINVYTPAVDTSKKPMPVIFFIHPGGFYAMTGRSDLAGPHYLLDRDVVLVTINYRLGSLGFLSTGDALSPGNNGMKDQVVALRWVQRNIAAFGGDPHSVTIAGCSAGSISVLMHMISPMSKGLFHRGIGLSGAPQSKEPSPRHLKALAVKQAELVKCPTDNMTAIYECLKSKPWRELGNSLPGFFEYGYDPVGLWQPVVELDFGQERFLPIEPLDAIREGKMHAVPFIISQTQQEFFWFSFSILKNETLLKAMNADWQRMATISFLLPKENSSLITNRLKEVYLNGKPLADDRVGADALGRLYTDSIVGFAAHRMANLMCRHSPQKVWYSDFGYVGNHSHYEDPVTGKPIGAAHHDDLIYLFSLSYRFPTIPVSSPDSRIVDRMTALWYNFARYGDPNPRGDTPELGSLCWPPMTPTNRTYLRIDNEFSIQNNLREERYKLWEELYPIQY